MERKIVLRGKNRYRKEWLYGNLSQCGDGSCGIDGVPVETDSVGQFTGLLDKNGKEIYEGDIIRIDSHAWLDWKELDSVNAEVIFEEYMFDARWRNPDAGQPIPFHPDDDPDYEPEYICEMLVNLPNTIKVIGNRFDNPSLISDKQ